MENENMQVNDQVLLKACNLYHKGKFKDCLETLNKVSFTAFNTQELEYENNKLVCQSKICNQSELQDDSNTKFQALWEKVRGLPCQLETISLVMSVGLNYSFVLLSRHTSGKVIDGCFKVGEILTDSLLQAAEVLGSTVRSSVFKEKQLPFAPTVLNYIPKIVEELLSQPLKPTCHRDKDLIILNCWVLAMLWMSQHHVDAGFKLLSVLKYHLENKTKTQVTGQNTIIVDPSIVKQLFPLSLLTCTSQQDLSLKSLVLFLMSLYVKFCQNDNKKALNLLHSSDDGTLNFYSSYLKGLIYYESNKFDESMSCFHHCMDIIDIKESHRAAASCMIGCCLSRKDKPNTAIAKFKEALSRDFGHLDALFYIVQQQRRLGKHDVEIQSLQYLCKALAARSESSSVANAFPSLLQGPFISFIHSLNGTTISREYVNYWLGKRCLGLQRFSEASDALIDVIAAVTSNTHQLSMSPNYSVPTSTKLYRDCAFAMLKVNKTKDCVTVCDHALKQLKDITLTEVKDKAGKRQRSSLENKETEILELMLCKAFALLDQPLASLETLQRVFDDLGNSLQLSVDEKDLDSRLCKRRKFGVDDITEETLLDAFRTKNDNNSGLLAVKSQAHMIRATVLQSLDKEKDSLEELYQSLICNPDNITAIYHYTRLLFKLGSKKVAASNWIKYKELHRESLSKHNQTTRNSEQTCLPFLFEVTEKEIQDIDNLALKYC